MDKLTQFSTLGCILAACWNPHGGKADAAPGPAPSPAKPAGAATAAPAPDTVYRQSMAGGRALDQQGDHVGAMARFKHALAAHPEDAAALSELGWAAFQAGQLDEAAQATTRAVVAAKDPRLKAASLYNLGRIAEQRQDLAGARKAYEESLTLRKNTVVRARLAALTGGTAGAEFHGVPGQLFADLNAYCRSLSTPPGFGHCGVEEKEALAVLGRPTPPYKTARVFWTGESETVPANSCHLAVQLADGFSVFDLSSDCYGNGRYYRRLTIRTFELKDVVPGGAPELVLRYDVSASDPVDYDDGTTGIGSESRSSLVVCGLAEGGALSCVGPLETAVRYSDDQGKHNRQYTLDVTFREGGKLEGKAAPGSSGKLPPEMAATLGTHSLKFP